VVFVGQYAQPGGAQQSEHEVAGRAAWQGSVVLGVHDECREGSMKPATKLLPPEVSRPAGGLACTPVLCIGFPC
jgi:hypothetical protein